jgi:hypothetical protein
MFLVHCRGREPQGSFRLTIDTFTRRLPIATVLAAAGCARTLPSPPRRPLAGAVTRVEIDPRQLFPDADRSNNIWTPGARQVG